MEDNFCAIALYLYGNSIALDEVSSLLGLSPTRSRKRGDVRVTSSGSEVTQRIGFWEYRERVEVGELSTALIKMVDRINCGNVVGQAGIEKAELDIFVPMDLTGDSVGFGMELSTGVLCKLSGLGFDLVVTSR